MEFFIVFCSSIKPLTLFLMRRYSTLFFRSTCQIKAFSAFFYQTFTLRYKMSSLIQLVQKHNHILLYLNLQGFNTFSKMLVLGVFLDNLIIRKGWYSAFQIVKVCISFHGVSTVLEQLWCWHLPLLAVPMFVFMLSNLADLIFTTLLLHLLYSSCLFLFICIPLESVEVPKLLFTL